MRKHLKTLLKPKILNGDLCNFASQENLSCFKDAWILIITIIYNINDCFAIQIHIMPVDMVCQYILEAANMNQTQTASHQCNMMLQKKRTLPIQHTGINQYCGSLTNQPEASLQHL